MTIDAVKMKVRETCTRVVSGVVNGISGEEKGRRGGPRRNERSDITGSRTCVIVHCLPDVLFAVSEDKWKHDKFVDHAAPLSLQPPFPVVPAGTSEARPEADGNASFMFCMLYLLEED